MHVALTGETDGYYADFEPLAALAKVCETRLLPRRHVLVVPRPRPRRRRSTPTAMPDLAARGLQPEPRPDRQPRRRRPAHRDARRRPARLRRAAHARRRRSRRCCSWARSGRPRRRSSSSPRTPSRSSAGPPPRAGSRSSSGWAGTRPSCPTRRTPRRSSARSSTGPRSAPAGTRAMLDGVPAAGGAAARRCRELTDPAFARDRVHRRRGARLFTMRRGDLAGGRELRRRPGDPRRGRHRAALRHRSRGVAGRCTVPASARGCARRAGPDVGRHATYLSSHPPRPGDGAGCSSPSGTPGGIVG